MVTIAKATPEYALPTGLTATYGQTLADIALPFYWTWADTTTSVGNAGTTSFKATYTPADLLNYNVVTDIDVTITVGKAIPTYTVPTGITAIYGQTLADLALPDNWEWQDADTTEVGIVGDRTFKATYTPSDTDNYEAVTDIEITITVKQDPATEEFDGEWVGIN